MFWKWTSVINKKWYKLKSVRSQSCLWSIRAQHLKAVQIQLVQFNSFLFSIQKLWIWGNNKNTQLQSVREEKDKLIIKDQHRWVCVCDSDGLLIELFLLTNAWTSIIIESNGFIYMIVFQMHVWRCSFRSSSEQLQDQFSHRDSDWPRFLYDSLSLCEHIFAVDDMKTLTVIMSSIFSLDSTDGQSEIGLRSTATESRWSSWLKGVCPINQEFRSFSRFL